MTSRLGNRPTEHTLVGLPRNADAKEGEVLLCTTTADLPRNDQVDVLWRSGKLCLLGIPAHAISLSPPFG